jgi:hypothetical protein
VVVGLIEGEGAKLEEWEVVTLVETVGVWVKVPNKPQPVLVLN